MERSGIQMKENGQDEPKKTEEKKQVDEEMVKDSGAGDQKEQEKSLQENGNPGNDDEEDCCCCKTTKKGTVSDDPTTDGKGDKTGEEQPLKPPDLEKATEEWMVGEKQQRKKLLFVMAGSVIALVVASVLWFKFVSIETLPVACEAAVLEVQNRCGISRRETIDRIRLRPPVVEEKDENRRETCRVIASPDHEFWREPAEEKIRELMKENKMLGAALSEDGRKKSPLTGLTLNVEGQKEPIPIPSRIMESGPLSDTCAQFITLVVIPEFIDKYYCSPQP